jgi:hypothetical protein
MLYIFFESKCFFFKKYVHLYLFKFLKIIVYDEMVNKRIKLVQDLHLRKTEFVHKN